MSKGARMVNPAQITDLSRWVSVWPKAPNLAFDAKTREPVVYNSDKTENKRFPWIRAGDIITIITQPQRYPAAVVAAAREQYAAHQRQNGEQLMETQAKIQEAEKAVLMAWQEYNAVAPAARAVLRPGILAKERVLQELERSMINPERRIKYIAPDNKNIYTTTYTPPYPIAQRSINLAASIGEQTV